MGHRYTPAEGGWATRVIVTSPAEGGWATCATLTRQPGRMDHRFLPRRDAYHPV